MAEVKVSTLTGTGTCVARTGVTDDGVKVSGPELVDRARWLACLCQQLTASVVAARWNPADLAILAGNADGQGRPLPAKGAAAARRLGWTVSAPAGVYVPERVGRTAHDYAVRLLRAGTVRGAQVAVLLATWPADPGKRSNVEWNALHAAERETGIVLSKVVVRNRTRNIAAFVKEHGRLPADITELETAPRAAAQVLLAAADKQFVTLETPIVATPTVEDSDRVGVLRVQLPICAQPVSRHDWEWVRIPFTIGRHVPSGAAMHTPTLRIVTDPAGTTTIRLDVPHTSPVPTPVAAGGHVTAVGFDWGVNTALTGVTATLDPGTSGAGAVVRTDGRPVFYTGAGITHKLHKVRRTGEQLAGKIVELEQLLGGVRCPLALPAPLVDKHELLRQELAAVSARRANLGSAFAWNVARWAVDYAHSQGASVIFIEDLATLEHAGLGKKQNRRTSTAMRGKIRAALQHVAARDGIAVVDVPARGTSALCPRCLAEHRHVKAPNNRTTGHMWAICECGHTGNRDHSSAERIVSRGLAGQAHTRINKSTGQASIRTVIDVPVRITRTPKPKPKPKLTRAARRNRRTATLTTAATRVPRLRTKTEPTPRRPRKKTAPHSGQVRLTGLAASTPPPTGARVQRPDAPTPSSRHAPAQGPQCGLPNRLSPAVRARRRVQARGFPGRSHPTWINPRHPKSTDLHRV